MYKTWISDIVTSIPGPDCFDLICFVWLLDIFTQHHYYHHG